MTEIAKLAAGLIAKGIPFTASELHGGWKIDTGSWDAVCHDWSYGGKEGLLEIMGVIVENDADDILARI